MKKKLLTILLSVFMIATSFTTNVFADGEVAQIGETKYGTLQAAIDAAKNDEVVDLLVNVEENVEITGKAVYIKPQDKAEINGSIVAECFVESETNGVLYGDLSKAVDIVTNGNKSDFVSNPMGTGNTIYFHALKNIKLNSNIILPFYGNTNSTLYFNRYDGLDEPVTLDLNGYKISQEYGNPGGYWFGTVRSELANLIIKDSSDAKTGEITGYGSCVVVYGYTGEETKITLESGTLSMLGDTPYNGNGIVQTQYAGSFEMTGGTIDGSTVIDDNKSRGNFELMNPDDTYGRPDISISGGKIKCVSENNRDSYKTTGYVSPDGFMFNRLNTDVSSTVTGGYYDFYPSAYVAQDYEAIRLSETSVGDDKNAFDAGYSYKVVEKKIAKIGDKTYPSLEAAIADVPTNGTETTITMIADETFKNINNPLIINKDQNVIIDLNSKTVKQEGTKIATESSAFITNNGTLTIDDYSVEKNGKLISNPSADNSYNAGHNTIANNSILNVINGTIEMQGSSGLFWAINNGSYNTKGVVANISGGKVINSVGYQAINLYAGHDNGRSQDVTVNISKNAIIESKSNVAIGLYAGGSSTKKANLSLNISDGTIIGNHGERAAIYVWKGSDVPSGCDYSNVRINITGGKFESNVNYIATWDSSDLATVTGLNKENIISAGIMNTEINDSEIAPGYTCIANKDASTKDTYHFMIGERTSGKVVIADTDNDVPEYYEKVSELQDAIDNLTKANEEKFEKNEKVNVSTIEVNGSGITAQIDDKVKIIADEGSNTVTADPGYKMNSPQTSGGKTTYTATALDIGKYVTNTGTIEDAPIETRGKKASEKKPTKVQEASQEITQAVQESAGSVNDTEASNSKQLETIVSEGLNNILSNRGINQGTAAKALNNSGIVTVTNEETSGTTKASSISVFVRTYYDTEVTEDKTDQANKSFKLDITPMYQAYASTATTIGSMIAEGDATAIPTNINAVKIGNSVPVDCTGKTITLRVQLPDNFITDISQKVYVVHTLANGTKTYDTTVSKEEGTESTKFFVEFTNPDGFSVFEFTLENPNPIPGPTPSSDPKPRYKVPNTGVEGTVANNHSLLKLSSLSLLTIGTYMAIKKKKDN